MSLTMTGKSPRCSIVIRAYNEAAHLGRLLAGIQQQTIQDVEVILVDSGSTDKTVEIARQFQVQIVQIEPHEFTFGRSLNLGIRHANADLIVIASAHVYPVYPDWLEKLLAPFDNIQVGLVYGKQSGAPGTYYSEHQIFAQWFPEESRPRQDHPFCNNANASIRRSLWEKRPYDENLTGLEDLDWANWMLSQGQQISYVAEAEIIHVHQETPRKVYNRYRREAMAFKRIFPQEHFNLWNFLRLYTSNVFYDLGRARQEKSLGKHWRSILWFRFMQFWGTYQGYQQAGPLTWQLRQTFYYPPGRNSLEQNRGRQVSPIQYNEPKEH
jgi:rhamnosyltransferase